MLGDLVENTGRFDVIVGHLIARGESLSYFSANRSARELRMGLIMRRGRPESERRNLLMRPNSRLTERQWSCFRTLSHSTGRLGFCCLRSPAKQIDKGGGCQNHDGQQEKRAKGKYNGQTQSSDCNDERHDHSSLA